ncbi:hypothetical protein FisN_2Hu011 [Fistulifera solaris]|uniref:SRCR domain-containing protein n=1 Tax=Fistulifera solaris TaxID=1519565 RepID=A0A1Z5KPE7_FISSO|nr:hypothetical protein FisN_2Hu011 [Fistulifera solaris]|eukprot:GAX28194.1 hypothetical protein FisN_2Hu011 [Fistulifera solaris]
MNKLLFASLVLCFLSAFIEAETENGHRSLLLRNFLCLPLFDGCNWNSNTVGNGSGDSCMDDRGVCAETTEGGVVCVTEGLGDGDPCSRSRDCSGNRVCITLKNGFCVTQLRRSD